MSDQDIVSANPTATRFPLNEETCKRIASNFTYHAPNGSQPERYVAVREKAKELATLMNQCCYPSRELSVAMTSLEDSVMWCNAGIARNG